MTKMELYLLYGGLAQTIPSVIQWLVNGHTLKKAKSNHEDLSHYFTASGRLFLLSVYTDQDNQKKLKPP